MSPRNQPNQPNARLIIALALASSTIGIAGAVFFLASAPTPAPEPAASQTTDASAEDAALRDLRSRICSLVTSDDDDD